MSKQKAVLMMVAAAFLWSLGGLFIKLVNWNPIVIAGMRSGIAGLVMLAFAGKLPKKFSIDIWLGGICYALLALSFIVANKMTTSTNAILLQFTSPIWLAIFSIVILKERLRKRDLIVIISVMLGMVLFFLGNLSFGSLIGNLIAIVAGILQALMILIMKKDKANNPLHMTLSGSLILFLVGLPFCFIYPMEISTQNIMSILILGIFQLGLGYVFYTKSIHHVSHIEAVIIPVIEPLVNPVWVFLVIGERPSIFALIGGTIVVTNIIISQIIDARQIQEKSLNTL